MICFLCRNLKQIDNFSKFLHQDQVFLIWGITIDGLQGNGVKIQSKVFHGIYGVKGFCKFTSRAN